MQTAGVSTSPGHGHRNSWAPPSWLPFLKGSPKNRLLQSPWPETLLTQITLAEWQEEENIVICTEMSTEVTEG